MQQLFEWKASTWEIQTVNTFSASNDFVHDEIVLLWSKMCLRVKHDWIKSQLMGNWKSKKKNQLPASNDYMIKKNCYSLFYLGHLLNSNLKLRKGRLIHTFSHKRVYCSLWELLVCSCPRSHRKLKVSISYLWFCMAYKNISCSIKILFKTNIHTKVLEGTDMIRWKETCFILV